jgi:protein-disulfide isomerase
MTRFAPLAIAALLALPAQALDLTNMSPAEREAFREEVRAYLLDNPQIIMEAVSVLEERNAAQQVNNDLALVKQNARAIFDDGYSWVGGNPDGDITVVEFLDYRCGYCRKAFRDVQALVQGDTNIRFVVKELPILGPESLVMSRFAVATKQIAGDEAYGMLHDAMMEYRGAPDAKGLARLAESLGIDPEPIMEHLDDPAVIDEIRQTRVLAEKLGINGTPTFVFGEQLIRGYIPLDQMQAVIKDQRDG